MNSVVSFAPAVAAHAAHAAHAAPAGSATSARPHVTVCICTFRRPELLQRLLTALEQQRTGGGFTFSIVVSDNDAARSGREVTSAFAAKSAVGTVYTSEPEQNIALARNRAIAAAQGEYIAFLDDDEFPVADWLRLMLDTCETHRSSGVLGPVRPHFDNPPPRWVVRGRFCERAEQVTGTVVPWNRSRTGNLLFRRSIIAGLDAPFRPQFGTGGEDVDFFSRMAALGHTFVWCNEAVAYEVVPPSRCTRRYMLQRALLRGRGTLKIGRGRGVAVIKSAVAIPTYAAALPFTVLLGHHVSMHLLIRLCDHLGRMLALVGLNPIDQRPV